VVLKIDHYRKNRKHGITDASASIKI